MNLVELSQCVEQEFTLFDSKFSACLPNGDDTLGRLSDYALCQKGKRLRPLVSFLIAKTCGGASEATYRAAVILELLHTASLVHDDVLDESKLRRGKRTINDIWDNKTAILFGDYIYGVCLHLIETKEDFELLDIYSKIARELPQGELLQKDVTDSMNCSEETYFNIIDGKTASLFGASAYVGAKTAKGSKDYSKEAEQFGRMLGRAFQIRDDILDLTLETDSGKGHGNDIKEKKITLPIIFLLKELGQEEKSRLLEFIAGDDKTDDDIARLLKSIQNTDCLNKAEQQVIRYSQMAKQHLQTLPENDYRKKLEDLTDYLVLRNL